MLQSLERIYIWSQRFCRAVTVSLVELPGRRIVVYHAGRALALRFEPPPPRRHMCRPRASPQLPPPPSGAGCYCSVASWQHWWWPDEVACAYDVQTERAGLLIKYPQIADKQTVLYINFRQGKKEGKLCGLPMSIAPNKADGGRTQRSATLRDLCTPLEKSRRRKRNSIRIEE